MSITIIIILVIACVGCALRMWMLSNEIRRLRKSQRVKTAFLRNISHEIRTPLHTVTGLAEVITSDSLYLSKGDKKNISDQIKSNTELISTLFDEAMLYIDNRSEGHTIVNERLNPNFLCRSCLQTIQSSQTAECKTKLVFKRTLRDDFFISTDPHILQLILSKLIHLACRFSPEGNVSVGCNNTEVPDKLTFYVEDSGTGIPEERKAMIFKWFEHPEESTDSVEMDLSIIQMLARRIGGEVSIDANYTGGTRMLVILPTN